MLQPSETPFVESPIAFTITPESTANRQQMAVNNVEQALGQFVVAKSWSPNRAHQFVVSQFVIVQFRC